MTYQGHIRDVYQENMSGFQIKKWFKRDKQPLGGALPTIASADPMSVLEKTEQSWIYILNYVSH